MHHSIYRKRIWFCVFPMCLAPLAAAAEGDWSTRLDVQNYYGVYQNSVLRKDIRIHGLLLSGDYLDRLGLTLAVNALRIGYRTATPAIDQQAYFASLRYHAYPDAWPGVLTWRLDAHSIHNNDTLSQTGGLKVLAPTLSFMDFSRRYAVELGYADSRYQSGLRIRQWTPMLGVAFNAQADWLQFRFYSIRASIARLAQGKASTRALEGKWTHWLAPGSRWRPLRMTFTWLLGERVYAVDGDAVAVYNLADVQKGGASLAVQWRMREDLRLVLVGGQERYYNRRLNDAYQAPFLYADVSMTW